MGSTHTNGEESEKEEYKADPDTIDENLYL